MRWPGWLALFLCSRRAPLGARYRVDVVVSIFIVFCAPALSVSHIADVFIRFDERCLSIMESFLLGMDLAFFFQRREISLPFLGFKTRHCPSQACYADRDRTPLDYEVCPF